MYSPRAPPHTHTRGSLCFYVQYGLGVDNVLEYSVALPSGKLVKANAGNKYSDLFWAMRGAGHQNFGVMTSMRYVPPPAPTWLQWLQSTCRRHACQVEVWHVCQEWHQ